MDFGKRVDPHNTHTMLSMIRRRLPVNPGCVVVVVVIAITFFSIISVNKQFNHVVLVKQLDTAMVHRTTTEDIIQKTMENYVNERDSTSEKENDAASKLHESFVDTLSDKVDYFFGRVKSNMVSWTFQERVTCNQQIIGTRFTSTPRRKLTIECQSGQVHISYPETFLSSDVLTFRPGDPCLQSYVNAFCRMNHRIPNIVHYVWYGQRVWDFVPFLSTLSVIRFVKPCAIIFHGDLLPTGKYWDALTKVYPNIIHVISTPPTSIFGVPIQKKTHASDIMRIRLLIEYGGIYLDTDTILVQPIQPLMNYPCVMSSQNESLGSAFIMSERNGSFLHLWENEYRVNYHPDRYVFNAMKSPKNLSDVEENKHLIHVENGTISRPMNMRNYCIYKNKYATYNWSNVYGIHLFITRFKDVVNETTIRTMNTTFGSICRHVFYGNKEMCL